MLVKNTVGPNIDPMAALKSTKSKSLSKISIETVFLFHLWENNLLCSLVLAAK
jgi:hypothetical protein